MQLFPERIRQNRRLILAAVLLSLLAHSAGGSLWAFLNHSTHAMGKAEDQVANASTVTIEKIRPTPPPTPAPQVVARTRHAPPAHRVLLPDAPQFSTPTLAPAPEPIAHHPRATIHVPRSNVIANVPVPRGERGSGATSGGLTSRAISAMEGSFRKTIAQAQQSVDTTPGPSHPVASMKEYRYVTKGTAFDDIMGGEGICNPIADGETRGAYTYYYLTCSVTYTDGYSERVSFPWPFKFTRRDDPFFGRDGMPQRFPPQSPPPGFALPHPFAVSRAVCFYYRAQCTAVFNAERTAGGPGS